ncbi:hypothetical protein K435DRAFT_607236, partial [Dendrothele bispora CBS 962.96]
LSMVFDETKFLKHLPLTFEDVLWLVLNSPESLSFEDVSWESVKPLFSYAGRVLSADDFREFVAKSHWWFHPDRWQS